MIRGWKRSPRGKIFGVVTGLAEWRDLDPQMARTVATIIAVCTMPASIIIYLLLALFLPMDHGESAYEDSTGRHRGTWENDPDMSSGKRRSKYADKAAKAEDAEWEERSTDDIRKEYEELKRKVESMESEMFDKEKDWDQRFRDSEDRK